MVAQRLLPVRDTYYWALERIPKRSVYSSTAFGRRPHLQLALILHVLRLMSHSAATSAYGPLLIDNFISAVQTTIICVQVAVFWQHAERYSRIMKGLIAFITLVSLIQTAGLFRVVWLTIVKAVDTRTQAFGGLSAFPIFQALLATPVQGVYTWRCYLILGRRPWLPLLLCGANITSAALYIYCTSAYSSGLWTQPLAGIKQRPHALYLAALSLTIFIDVVLSSLITGYLFRSLRNIYAARYRRITYRLVVLVWECFLPPTICGIATLVSYGIFAYSGPSKNWDVPIQGALGKLYAISLLVSVNVNVSYEAEQESRTASVIQIDTTIALDRLPRSDAENSQHTSDPPEQTRSLLLDDGKHDLVNPSTNLFIRDHV
ncbi:unnamed protein product [Peniophora sp. CBMAI 1063]|nr:unnamed protein product [Peniophora sp. CBMAI 1063]